jgi:LmbE family N-acetylglucosaminyl deacetylase
MKLNFANDRLLAVTAHPDDAELLCAGTLARAKADGAAIGIVVMCRGDKGVGSAGAASQEMGRVRQEEASAAAEVLGAQLFWFGAGDGELFDSYESRRGLIEIFRRFRPTLAITHAPEDYHADHRAASQLAEAASWFCASRGHVTQSPAVEAPPALWFADTLDMIAFEPQIFVDISAQLAIKQRMLAMHRSQLQRCGDRDLGPLAELMSRQAGARGAQAGVAAAEAFRPHNIFKRIAAW